MTKLTKTKCDKSITDHSLKESNAKRNQRAEKKNPSNTKAWLDNI